MVNRIFLYVLVCLTFTCSKANCQLIGIDSSFTNLPDKLIFETKNLLPGVMDGTTIHPTKFRIFLPKEFLTGEYSQTFFQFYFPGGQAVFIETNWNKLVNKMNTICSLSQDRVQDFFDKNKLSNNPDTIKLKKGRVYVLVKTKYASIYLYNILKANKNKYIEYANSFTKL